MRTPARPILRAAALSRWTGATAAALALLLGSPGAALASGDEAAAAGTAATDEAAARATPVLRTAPTDRWGGALTDLEIGDAVEDELRFDQAVSVNDIDITVDRGVVTLQGSVNDLLTKERAARIAETVKGVVSVVNRIAVEPYWGRADSEIEADAREALLRDPATDAWEIDVQVRHNVATLGGTVDSAQERALAETVVAGVRGVTGVDNAIVVRLDPERPDYEIRKDVEQTLRWDVRVDDALVAVSVTDGAVTLDGVVGSAAERRQAHLDAWVAGVRSVDSSSLQVRYWARDERLRKDKYTPRSDEAVAAAVTRGLEADPRVDADAVTVAVAGGDVTLRGRVADLRAKRAAADTARLTVGVRTVTNRLRVRPEARKDAAVEVDIAAALRRNPFVERYDIAVDVEGGTAYVSGTVDSYFEKGVADDIVARTHGVLEVRNNLEVDRGRRPLSFDPYVDQAYPFAYTWYDYEPRYSFLTDTQIRERVRDELWWSPYVDADAITVVVDGGRVTLTGTVPNWRARDAAAQNAWEGGAVWVDNDLIVK